MKGDFTRSTFDPKKHYSSVRMQQGRLQLDADWNEQVDIQAHLNQAQIKDLIGLSGVPETENNELKSKISPLDREESLKLKKQNFKISPLDPKEGYFEISPGQIYVDGILCQLEEKEKRDNTVEDSEPIPTTYPNQPDYPNALEEDLGQEELPEGDYIVYLDVWQRHITSVDDPQIREVALNNVPDTATRTKTIWQVKLLKLTNDNAEEKEEEFLQRVQKKWLDFLDQKKKNNIFLTPKVSDNANLENHLYRVEIHEADKAGKATFKWSRDNGFVVSAIEKIDGNIITIRQNNNEAWQLARPRQWVEIIRSDQTENWELAGKPGILARLQRVSGSKLIIDLASLKNPLELTFPKKFDQSKESSCYKIRLWDYSIDTGEKAGIPIPSDDTEYISLEEGIEIKFTRSGNYQTYQTGDYWLIPTRKNRLNPLDLPTNGDDSSLDRQLPPNGIEHHYTCLALIKLTNKQELEVQDCRPFFLSLIDVLDRLEARNIDELSVSQLQVQSQEATKAQGKISQVSSNVSFRYSGEGFEELNIGDTIIVTELDPSTKKQARSIKSIDHAAQTLTINKPFDPPINDLSEQKFSYQKPLARFSDSSGENAQLIVTAEGNVAIGKDIPTDGSKLDVEGKIKAAELELSPDGTLEAGTFKAKSLELGTRQAQNSFLNYGLIQAEELDNNRQINFTAESNVRFVFLKKQVDDTPSPPLVVIDGRLKVNGIVDAKDFHLNGEQWILNSDRISDGAIINHKLADNAVTAAKLSADTNINQNRAVTTDHIRNDAVTSQKLADNAVTADKLANDANDDQNRAVTTDHIRNDAVTSQKLDNNAVTSQKLADNTVTSQKLDNNAVTADKLANDANDDQNRAVTTDHIRNGAVTSQKLADNAVTSQKLDNNAVTSQKLDNNAVTADKLANDANDDQNRAVTTDHIRNGAVTTSKLKNGAITLAKLNDSVIPNLHQWSDGDNGSIYYSDGDVGIGTNIPSEKLQVNGSVKINNDLSYGGTLLQSSSRTLKSDITELSIQEANQILKGLNPIKFNYKKNQIDHPHIGFIAEEVPDLVASSDKQAICPVDIIAVLTKTVQQQQQKILQLAKVTRKQKQEIAMLQENFQKLFEEIAKTNK